MNDYVITNTIVHRYVVKTDYNAEANTYETVTIKHNLPMNVVIDNISNLMLEGLDVHWSMDCLNPEYRTVTVYLD